MIINYCGTGAHSITKVHLSKTIQDWLRPLRIVSYRAIIYASFSKRSQMTVTWSNFVNNTLIAYTTAGNSPHSQHFVMFFEC